MDVEKRSIGDRLKNFLVIVWVIASTVLYSSLALITFPLNRRLARYLGACWNRQLLFVAGVRVKARGIEQLDSSKRYVFIANHQSHIDIPVLYSTMPVNLSFIAKKELFRIPFFGWALWALGHIWIDRSNARKAHASINRAVSRLQNEHTSLVLFPEGTRSSDGTMGQLKQGSFSLVLKAGVEVVPVVIHDSIRIVKKHSKKFNSGTVHVTILPSITIDRTQTKADIAGQLQTQMVSVLEKGFTE